MVFPYQDPTETGGFDPSKYPGLKLFGGYDVEDEDEDEEVYIDWGDGKKIGMGPALDAETKVWLENGGYDDVYRVGQKTAAMALQEVYESPSDFLPWVGSMREADKLFEVHRAATIYDQLIYGNLSPNDPEVEQATRILAEFLQETQRDTTAGYDFVSLLTALPAFYGEFGAGRAIAGTSAVGKKGLAKLVKELVEESSQRTGRRSLSKKIGRELKEYLAKELPSSAKTYAAMEIPNMVDWALGGHGGRTSASAYRRALPNMELRQDELDNMQIAMDQSLGSFWESLPAGVGDMFIETLSEQFGSSRLLKRAKGAVGKRIPGMVRLKQLQHQVVGDLMKKKRISGFLEASNRILKQGGWDGMWEEWLEERFGSNVRSLTMVGEDEFILQYNDGEEVSINWDRLTPDFQQWGIELAAFAVPGVGASLADVAVNRENYSWRRQMDAAESLGRDYVPHSIDLGILSADEAAFTEENGRGPVSELELAQWVEKKWQESEQGATAVASEAAGRALLESEEELDFFDDLSDQERLERERMEEVAPEPGQEAEEEAEDEFGMPSAAEVRRRMGVEEAKLENAEMEEERRERRLELVTYLEEEYDTAEVDEETLFDLIEQNEDEDLRELAYETGDYRGLRAPVVERVDSTELSPEVQQGLEGARRKLEADEEQRGTGRTTVVEAVEAPSIMHAHLQRESLTRHGIEVQYAELGYESDSGTVEGGGIMGRLVKRKGQPDVMLVDHRLPVTTSRDAVAGVIAHEAWHPRFAEEEELLTEYLSWAEEVDPEALEQSRAEVAGLYDSVFDKEAYRRETGELPESQEEFEAWKERKINDEVGAFTAQRLVAMTHAMKVPGSQELMRDIATGKRSFLDDLVDAFKAVGNSVGGRFKYSYEQKLARLQQLLDQLDPTGESIASTENVQLALALEGVMQEATLGYYRKKAGEIGAAEEPDDWTQEELDAFGGAPTPQEESEDWLTDEEADQLEAEEFAQEFPELAELFSMLRETFAGNETAELTRDNSSHWNDAYDQVNKGYNKTELLAVMQQWSIDTKGFWGVKNLKSKTKKDLVEKVVNKYVGQVVEERELDARLEEQAERRAQGQLKLAEALELRSSKPIWQMTKDEFEQTEMGMRELSSGLAEIAEQLPSPVDGDWGPLELIVKEEWRGGFMYMGRHPKNEDVRLYKHGITRRYLYVDSEGITYEGNVNQLKTVPIEDAFRFVFELVDSEGSPFTRETDYDDAFREKKAEILTEAGWTLFNLSPAGVSVDTPGKPTTHRKAIIEAIAEGENVPAEVLADYPDIAAAQQDEVASVTKEQIASLGQERDSQVMSEMLPGGAYQDANQAAFANVWITIEHRRQGKGAMPNKPAVLSAEARSIIGKDMPETLEELLRVAWGKGQKSRVSPRIIMALADHLAYMSSDQELGVDDIAYDAYLRLNAVTAYREELDLVVLPWDFTDSQIENFQKYAQGGYGDPSLLQESAEQAPVDVAELKQRGTGQQLITGEEETEELTGERPGEGLPSEAVTQGGLYDEQGGLFEQQAEERDQGTADAAAQAVTEHTADAAAFRASLPNRSELEIAKLLNDLTERLNSEEKRNKVLPPKKHSHEVLNTVWAVQEYIREQEEAQPVSEAETALIDPDSNYGESAKNSVSRQFYIAISALDKYSKKKTGYWAGEHVKAVAVAMHALDIGSNFQGNEEYRVWPFRYGQQTNEDVQELKSYMSYLRRQIDMYAKAKLTARAYEELQGVLQKRQDKLSELNNEQRRNVPDEIRHAIETDPEFKVVYCVSCGKDKGSKRLKARDMYTGAIFRKRMLIAEKEGDEVIIISGKHGVLDPEQLIDPYDERMPKKGTKAWTEMREKMSQQLLDRYGFKVRYVMLGSTDYSDILTSASQLGEEVRADDYSPATNGWGKLLVLAENGVAPWALEKLGTGIGPYSWGEIDSLSQWYAVAPIVDSPQAGMTLPKVQTNLTEELDRLGLKYEGAKKKKKPKKARARGPRANPWTVGGKQYEAAMEKGEIDLITWLQANGIKLNAYFFDSLWDAYKEGRGRHGGKGSNFLPKLFDAPLDATPSQIRTEWANTGEAPDGLIDHLRGTRWESYLLPVDDPNRPAEDHGGPIQDLLVEAWNSPGTVVPQEQLEARWFEKMEEMELDEWLYNAQYILELGIDDMMQEGEVAYGPRFPEDLDAEAANEIYWMALEYALENPGVLELTENQQAQAERHKSAKQNQDAQSAETKAKSQELDPDGDVADVDDLPDAPFALRPDPGEAANPSKPFWSSKAVRIIGRSKTARRKWSSADQLELYLMEEGVSERELRYLHLAQLWIDDGGNVRPYVPNSEVLVFAKTYGLSIRDVDMPAHLAGRRAGMPAIDGFEQANLEHKIFSLDFEAHPEVLQFQLMPNPEPQHVADFTYGPNVLAEAIWDTRSVGSQGESTLFIHAIRSKWTEAVAALGNRFTAARSPDSYLEEAGWEILPYGMALEDALRYTERNIQAALQSGSLPSDPNTAGQYVAYNRNTKQFLTGIEAVSEEAYQGSYSYNAPGAHRFNSANAARNMVLQVLPNSGPWTSGGRRQYIRRVLHRAIREAAGRGQSMLSWATGKDVVDQLARRVPWDAGSFKAVEYSAVEDAKGNEAIELRFLLNDTRLGRPDGLSETGGTVIELDLEVSDYGQTRTRTATNGPDGKRRYEPWEILGHRVWNQIEAGIKPGSSETLEIEGSVWDHETRETHDREFKIAIVELGLRGVSKRTVTVGQGAGRVVKEAWSIEVPEEFLEDALQNGADTFALRPDRNEVIQDTIFRRFTLPREGLKDWLAKRIWDYFGRVKQVQNIVAQQGGFDAAIEESIDVYLTEELYGGRLMEVMNLQKLEYLNDLKAIMGELTLTQEQLDLEKDNDRRRAEVEQQAEDEGWTWREKRQALKEAKFNIYANNLDELGWYMYALTAEERNAEMAKRYPQLYGSADTPGSGMSDAEAIAIIDKVENFDSARREAFKEMALIVRNMNDAALEMRVESGLTSRKLAEQWRQTYPNYVPLRSDVYDSEDSTGLVALAGGFDIRGEDLYSAKGRRSLADNPVVFSIMQYQTTAIRAEKNRVARAFYEFVKANPDETQWTITVAGRGTFEEWQRRPVSQELYDEVQKRAQEENWDAEKLQEVLSQLPAVRTAEEVSAQRAKRQDVAVKVDGIEYRIAVVDPGLLRAMKNLGKLETGKWTQLLFGTPTRWLSRFNTAFDPEFVVRNALKDMQTAAINVQQYKEQDVKSFTFNMMKSWRAGYKGTWGVLKAETGGVVTDKQDWSEWEQAFLDYRAAGGKTAVWSTEDYTRAASNIMNDVKNSDPSKPHVLHKAFQGTLGFIERSNEGVENALRVSAFYWARKPKDDGGLGLSEARAASVAKNLTINFNRKGEWGPLVNSLFMFANAGIQGNLTVFKGVRKSKTIQAITGSLFVGGFLQGIMNNIMGGDDDEFGLPRADLIAEWELERSMVWLLPPGTLRPELEDRIKMPLAYGFHLFWYAGVQAAAVVPREMGGSGKPIHIAAKDMFKATVQNFNILGSGTLAQMVTPAVFDPIAMSVQNARWTGAPLRPEQQPYRDFDVPASQLHWGNVHPVSQQVADYWNELTGGDEYRPGRIAGFDVSVSPEDIEEWFNFFSAGPGRFLSRSTKVFNNPDLQIEDTPFARIFFGGKPERMAREYYYHARTQLRTMEAALEGAEEKSRLEERLFYKQYAPFIDLLDELDRTEKDLKEWRDIIRTEEYDDADKRWAEGEMRGLRAEFLRSYFKASDGNIWWQY